MMETGNEYVIAWAIYLLAVVGAQVLSWRIARPLPWADLRLVFQLFIFAILITPARLEPTGSYWVPAFMAALMDGLNYGTDQVLNRLWPIWITLLVLLLLSYSWKLFKAYKKTDDKPKENAG